MKPKVPFSRWIQIDDPVRESFERAAHLAGVTIEAVVGRALVMLSHDPSLLTSRSHLRTAPAEAAGGEHEHRICRHDLDVEDIMAPDVAALASALLLGQDGFSGPTRAAYLQLKPLAIGKLERRIGAAVEHMTAARQAPVPSRVAQRVADQMIEDDLAVPAGFFARGIFLRSLEFVLGVPEGLLDGWEPNVCLSEVLADMVELGHVRQRPGPDGEPQYQITSRGLAVANTLLPADGRRSLSLH